MFSPFIPVRTEATVASAQVSRQRWEVCKGGSVSALPVLPPVRPRGWYRFLPALLLGELWLAQGHRASWTSWAVAWRKLRTWRQADAHADPDLTASPPCYPGQVPPLPSSWLLGLHRRSKMHTFRLLARRSRNDGGGRWCAWCWRFLAKPGLSPGAPVTAVPLHLQG